MAKKVTTIVELTDDFDGGKADRTVAFSLNGTNYEIDLSKKNANAFEKVLKPYVDAARQVKPTRRSSSSRTSARRSPSRDLAAVRAWARDNGYEVSDRGRVPTSVLEAYDAS